jgi:nitrous oxide reductase
MDKFQEIKKTACSVSNISLEELESRSRKRYIVDARRMVFSMAKDYLNMKILHIAYKFNMNHASIIHQLKQHKDLMTSDIYYKDRFDKLVELYKQNISFINADELINEIKELKAENLRIETKLIQKNND